MGAGKLGSLWNIPVIAYQGTSELLSDKKTFDTFTRTVSLGTIGGHVAGTLAVYLLWDQMCVFYKDTGHLATLRRGMAEAAKQKNITISEFLMKVIQDQEKRWTMFKELMKECKKQCRGKCLAILAFLFCGCTVVHVLILRFTTMRT